MKKYAILAMLALVAIVFVAACQGAAPAAPTAAPQVAATTAPQVAPTVAPTTVPPTVAPTTAPPTVAPTTAAAASPAAGAASNVKVGEVTDVGGIDDKSFNATAWKGMQDAATKLGVQAKYLESQQQTDYAKNIQEFVQQKYDLIVTVGFLLADATKEAASKNATTKFAIVDSAYDPKDVPNNNILGLTFSTDEAAMLAGYVSAGASKTGKVGTFGGIKIPPVTIFMKGFEAGVKYYNQQNNAKVEVLGWDNAKDEGLFTGNFESTDDGKRFAEQLFDEGADIVMPVAGPVGLGSAAAAKERKMKIVGVDTDWYVSAPEFKETYLTSVMKNMDVAVFDTVKAVVDGTYKSGTYVGTLENAGVGIASFHDYDSQVPANVKTDLDQLKQAIIAGKVKVDDALQGKAPKLSEVAKPLAKIKVGEVTDVGGIDDKSFNATAWKGVQDAISKLGVEGKYLESQQQTDYAKNIQEFVQQKYDLIVTVGFLLADATKEAASKNATTKFAIVDSAYDPKDVPNNNILGLTFSTDQAAFLVGYASAGMSKTGKVGTFGGIKIPPVTIFMKGFEAGVKYYNQQNNAKVEVLGWDNAKDEGLFTGNFESTDDGKRFAEQLFDEGADIVMPVAGPVGLGSAAAAKERKMKIVGVDTDWYVSAPEFKETYLTSVMKNMDVAVFDAIKQAQDGTYKSGTYVGTLENAGVGMAPFHDYDSQVPAKLKADLDKIKADLIAGKITVDGVLGAK